MKKSLFFAAACVALASCSSDGYIGDPLAKSTGGEITFSQTVPNVTRASGTSADAAKLGNNFVVYGFKMGKDSTEAVNGSTDNKVFDLYNVNYVDGSANSTLSNTSGWEYVGLNSVGSVTQTIKYWDFNSKYVFSAISCGAGVTFTKITDAATIAGTTVQSKGWQLTVPASRTLESLYASDRKEMTKKMVGSQYSFGTVDFTFYSLASKIRFAMYETVSGYSVKIDTVRFGSTKSATHFGVGGTFKGTNSGAATTLIVTYDSSNHPVLAYDNESTSTSMQFGSNLLTATALGTASNTATYDNADGAYSMILPYESKNETEDSKKTNVLTLKLDYTLTSTDGSGEQIKIYGATATIPTEYTQWKNNYAYTYLFKISDNTSGSTGGDPSDPKGLYPITFDACVTSTNDGLQETITTVADPSITTYQSGSIGNEYSAGNITVSVYDAAEVALSKSNLKLYTAFSTDGKELTEKNVENYKNNGIVLTDVSKTINNYETLNNKTATFNAVADKTYVVEYTKSDKKYYKVIKVGTPDTPVYKFTAYSELACTNDTDKVVEGGTFYVKVEQMISKTEYAVTGAEKNFDATTLNAFTVAETGTAGTYSFTAKGGTKGGYDIKIAGAGDSNSTNDDISVLAYEFDAAEVAVIADNTDSLTITLNLGSSAAAEVDAATNFTVPTGVTITKVEDGAVTLKAATTAQSGNITFSNNGTVVATATVTVKHYSFDATSKVINISSVVDAEKSTTLTMKLAGQAITAATAVTTTATADVLTNNPTTTDATGKVSLTAKTKVGTATVKAPDNTEISIEVKNFAVAIYSDEACTSAVSTALSAGQTYYVKFTNAGVAENAAITASKGTLTKASGTGVYKWVAPATSAGETTIKYTYKTVQFTLFKQTF